MATAGDDAQSSVQCLRSAHDSLPRWRELLADVKSRTSARRASIAAMAGLEETSVQQQDEEEDSASSNVSLRGRSGSRSNHSYHGEASPTRHSSSKTEGEIQFDLATQQTLEELVRNVQVVQNQMLRRLAIARPLERSASPATPRSQKRRKVADFSPVSIRTDSIAGSPRPTISEKALDTVKLAETILKDIQRACESAAHKLLRKGTCDKELERVHLLLDRCEKMVSDSIGIAEDPALRTPIVRSRLEGLQPPSSSWPEELQVDDEDSSSSSSDEDELTKFNAIRNTGKQIAKRVGSRAPPP